MQSCHVPLEWTWLANSPLVYCSEKYIKNQKGVRVTVLIFSTYLYTLLMLKLSYATTEFISFPVKNDFILPCVALSHQTVHSLEAEN